MSKVHFIGDDKLVKRFKPDHEFSIIMKELYNYRVCALDTETTVTESYLSRSLKIITIAVDRGNYIAVLEYDYLTKLQKQEVFKYLRSVKCIIQNSVFDYKVLYKEGCILENIVCTMLAEQILHTGLSVDKGYNGLQAIYLRRFDIDISKAEQLSFGESPYNDSQVQYAAVDCLKLEDIYLSQVQEMKLFDANLGLDNHKGSYKTYWLENEFAKVVADMEINGIRINKEDWYAIEESIRPVFDEKMEALNNIVVSKYSDFLYKEGFMFEEDCIIKPIWSSAKVKTLVLDSIYPNKVEGTSKVALKKYLQEYDPKFPEGLKLSGNAWTTSEYTTTFDDIYAVIKLIIIQSKDVDVLDNLNEFVLSNCKDILIDLGVVKAANTLYLNWASPAQRLKLFKYIDSTIESTGKDVLEDYIEHKVIQVYLEWASVAYQLKNFGKPFYDKFVELDGKHRARYKQILATGRMSTSSPNILNISKEYDGAYRKCIIPDNGFVLVGSDYSGKSKNNYKVAC